MSGFLGTLIRRLRRPGSLASQVRDGFIYLDQLSGKVRVVDSLGGDRALEQTPGGGSSDHATLSHLAWSASAHTGTASQLAGFSGGGAAAYYAIGAAGGVQAYSATLDALVANGAPGATGLAVLLAANGSAARTTIGVVIGTDVQAYNASLAAIAAGTWTGATSITILGTVGTGVWQGTAVAVAYGGTGSGTAGGARTNLGLAIGSNVQQWDADLDAVAALGTTGLAVRTGAGTWSLRSVAVGSGQLSVSNSDGVSGNVTLDLVYASAIRETGGPTTLTVGAAADGSLLKRSGSTLVGVTAIVDSTTRTVGTPLDSTDARNYEPAFGYRHGYVQVEPGGGTPRVVGCIVTTRGTATDGSDAVAPYTTYTSAVSANASAGWWITAFVQSRHGAYARCIIKTPATITNYRLFIGFQSAETATDAGAAHQALLRYSTTAGDATFMLVTKDGTTQTTQADAAIAASTRYVVDIWLTATLMTVQINGAAATTKTTNLPGTSTLLGVICQATADAVPTGARKVDIDRIAWCQTT